MNLLVVLPFFSGDEHMLLDNLAWMKELDGKLNYPCLLSCDNKTDPAAALAAASEVFASVAVFQYPRSQHETWPHQQNNAFMQAAWHIGSKLKTPWLWCETDCVPMCPRWLDVLWGEYVKGKKPFGGHWNHATNVFNGVAIYPPNVAQFSQKAMTAALIEGKDASGSPYQPPWDAHASSEVKKHLHVMNDVMQHVWRNDTTGEAWTFPDRKTVEQVIRPNVVLFHRCKNGSLTARLREERLDNFVSQVKGMNVTRAPTADVVSLRRNGDIISLLPLLKQMADKLERPVRLVVMREYMPLLEGASYVEAVPWDGDMENPLEAAAKFNAVNAQVFGRRLKPKMHGGNFVRLAWQQLGHKWNRYAPLVFDNLDACRESALCEQVFKTDKPKVLVKMHGHSSPFSHAHTVMAWLKKEFSESAELVDLDAVKAERIYDLLGLMDRAACCITIDTVTIHLAPATACPMIQFVHDTDFGESPRKGHCLLRMPYAKVVSRMDEVIGMVRQCLSPRNFGTGMVLVFNNYTAQGDALQREGRARLTWPLLHARFHPFTPQRSSAQIGDRRAMPFVREMVHSAFMSGPENICVILNNDIQVGEGLREAIVKSCAETGCFWSYRTSGPGAGTDCGADLFAFTRHWWSLHAPMMPDLLHGYRWWDNLLIRLMLWSGCREQSRLYYHEPHNDDHRARLQTPGAKWNERLAAQWLDMYDEKDQRP